MRPGLESDFKLWLHFIFEANIDFINTQTKLTNGDPLATWWEVWMAWH